ncbi:hypothetical protein I350_00462 [Cryptococcus amylolentus CBS 6273]|uniref:SH3 domain-containing protein n=1 Tax=Cryptococcus amylolentus CBS 6273 TaxID=1296118 RepID=A0A1E3KF17_9TREE|nr:hypothetical protein I350_00462 [Cryptococcus amylolentus CBS 6273]
MYSARNVHLKCSPISLIKEAFFSLLDEYFASRGHVLAPANSPPAVDAASHPSRLLPPARNRPDPISPPPTASHYTSPISPTASRQSQEYGNNAEFQERPDMAQRFISSGVKYGTSGAKSGVGAISRNKDAMNLLGKAGMGGMVGKANDRLNKPTSPSEQTANKATPPPIAPKKGGGVSGLRLMDDYQTFGHVDTASKMGAFTSMWKDPKTKPAESIHLPPALSHSHSNLPPPSRRDGSGSHHAASPSPSADTSAPAGGDLANGSGVQQGQAQALYDYAGADSGDLTVQANQVVNIIAKTSSDWWTCEDGNGQRGLVPATYLQEI